MVTLIQVPIDAELAESLQEVAETQGQKFETVLADVVRQYLRQVRRDKIQQENDYFETMHKELKHRYLGKHVAIHNEQVVDHDEDVMALAKRVRERHGRLPILIALVQENLLPEFTIHRPSLAEPA